MNLLFRGICSEFQKTRHLSFQMIHFVVPLCAAMIFVLYYTSSPWDSVVKAEAYLQALGIGYQLIIALLCVMLSDQEENAGNFQEMLARPQRAISLYGKLIHLLLWGLFAIVFACTLFGIGYCLLLKQNQVPFLSYIIAGGILFGENVLLYIWHMFLALKFNKSISIGIGIVECLLSALLLTSMGDICWPFIPCAWGSRLVSFFVRSQVGPLDKPLIAQCHLAITLCAATTLLALVCIEVWFEHWDGRKDNE